MRGTLSVALGFALCGASAFFLAGCRCEGKQADSGAPVDSEVKQRLEPLLEQPLSLPRCFRVLVPSGAQEKKRVEIQLGKLGQNAPRAGEARAQGASVEGSGGFVVAHECDEMMSQEELARSLRAVLGQLKSTYGAYLAPPPLTLIADPAYSASALAFMKEEPTFFAEVLLTMPQPGEREILALRAFAARGGRKLALLIPQGPESQRLAATLRHPGFSARLFDPGAGPGAGLAWLRGESAGGK